MLGSFITDSKLQKLPISSLERILTEEKKGEEAPKQFRARFQVDAIKPPGEELLSAILI